MFKQLLEPFKKIDDLINSHKQDRDRLVLDEDLNDGLHVTRITGLRSLFIRKMEITTEPAIDAGSV